MAEVAPLDRCAVCGGRLTRPPWLPPLYDEYGVLCYADAEAVIARRYDCLQCMERIDRRFEVSQGGELTGQIVAERRWKITEDQLRVERHLAGLSDPVAPLDMDLFEEEDLEIADDVEPVEPAAPKKPEKPERRVSGDPLGLAGVEMRTVEGDYVRASTKALTKKERG